MASQVPSGEPPPRSVIVLTVKTVCANAAPGRAIIATTATIKTIAKAGEVEAAVREIGTVGFRMTGKEASVRRPVKTGKADFYRSPYMVIAYRSPRTGHLPALAFRLPTVASAQVASAQVASAQDPATQVSPLFA